MRIKSAASSQPATSPPAAPTPPQAQPTAPASVPGFVPAAPAPAPVVQPTTALATRPPAPSTELALPDYIEKSAEGFEHAKGDGMQLPMLVVGQGQSKEVLEGKIHAGDVSLSSDKETALFPRDTKVPFFIFFHHKQWIQWGDRDAGQGMIAQSFDPEGELAMMSAKRETVTYSKTVNGKVEEKTVQKVTAYHRFFIVFEGEEPGTFTEPVALALAKTKIKGARKLLTLAQKRGGAPIYAGKYNLWSYLDSNKKGQQYFNFEYENNGWATKPEFEQLKVMYAKTKEMYESIATLMADDDEEREEPEAAAAPKGGTSY